MGKKGKFGFIGYVQEDLNVEKLFKRIEYNSETLTDEMTQDGIIEVAKTFDRRKKIRVTIEEMWMD